MKKFGKRGLKVLAAVLCLLTVMLCLPMASFAAEPVSKDTIILYTNDIHTYIDGPVSYDVLAAVKKELATKYETVILADAGDHIQGTAYGSMDKGESIVELMNAAGYDIATLGNHEFDYNMQGCMDAIDRADFSYLSCNFYHEANGVRGENVLSSYKIFTCGEQKIAFVGITTPETFLMTTPTYFQDANGNFIYGISGGETGAALQQDVQKAVDQAAAEGADVIIALGHLGIDSASPIWTSTETISKVSGLDAFIDGHSHSVVKSQTVMDKDGQEVILTQTGQYFDRIGVMKIDAETGAVTTDFIELAEAADDEVKFTSSLLGEIAVAPDAEVKAMKDAWLSEIDTALEQKIGYAEVTLDNYSEGTRWVRDRETNTGDFTADALYYLFDDMDFDVDLAVMNGGSIRNGAVSGDLTYKKCKEIHPFGNVACLQTVTGQQILDMLEWGSRNVGESESGAFLQVAGVTYKIDTSVPNTVKANDMGIWTGAPDAYRVYDVMIYDKTQDKWVPLELAAKYNLAGYNYTLRDLGDGFAMLESAVNVVDYVMEDYMLLGYYIQGFENSTVGAKNSPLLKKYPNFMLDYATVSGSGRIQIVNGKPVTPEVPPTGDEGAALWVGVLAAGCAGLVWLSLAQKRVKN